MKCENCGRNEANFIYRSSINGRTEEHHLCQACAEKLGYRRNDLERVPQVYRKGRRSGAPFPAVHRG